MSFAPWGRNKYGMVGSRILDEEIADTKLVIVLIILDGFMDDDGGWACVLLTFGEFDGTARLSILLPNMLLPDGILDS
jgi:hypothetical protein